jgi:hypothetical protein
LQLPIQKDHHPGHLTINNKVCLVSSISLFFSKRIEIKTIYYLHILLGGGNTSSEEDLYTIPSALLSGSGAQALLKHLWIRHCLRLNNCTSAQGNVPLTISRRLLQQVFCEPVVLPNEYQTLALQNPPLCTLCMSSSISISVYLPASLYLTSNADNNSRERHSGIQFYMQG